MKDYDKTCRLCLKLTVKSDLIPLFIDNQSKTNVDWKRALNFIFHVEGLPDKVCALCKSQIEWMLIFQRQIYENDCLLRFEHTNEKKNNPVNDMMDEDAGRYYIVDEDEENNQTSSTVINNAQMEELKISNAFSLKASSRQFQAAEISYEHLGRNDTNTTVKDNSFVGQINESNNIEHTENQTNCNRTVKAGKEVKKIVESKERTDIEPMVCEATSEENNIPLIQPRNKQLSLKKIVYKCTICDKFCNTKLSLKNHSTIHNNEEGKLYLCDLCDKTFKTLHNFKIHKNKHTLGPTEKFKCPISTCNRSYVLKNKLKTHIKQVHQGYFYKCPSCTLSFNYRTSAVMHIRALHPDDGIEPVECKEAPAKD